LRHREVVEAVRRALERTFGISRHSNTGDPLDGLILTILSQNTNDRNRDRAFGRLRERFPTWQDVLNAGPEALEEAIRVGGLARVKAQRIFHLLEGLTASQGRLTLDGLRALSPQEAERALLAIPGVGKKTARCVLLFELGHPSFPVDTHILRVTRRLGWVPERASADRAHDILQRLIPPEAMESLHLNLIQLGRALCRPKHPRQETCPIRRWCRHAGGDLALRGDELEKGSRGGRMPAQGLPD
jgi:endonuclease-3